MPRPRWPGKGFRRRAPGLAVGLVLSGAALLVVSGCGAPERVLTRLTELQADTGAEPSPKVVAGELALTVDRPQRLAVRLSGARVGRLTLTARGDAATLGLEWKLASEKRFSRFRRLDLPLVADGEERRYAIDLSNEPYWVGTIDALRLSVPAGALEVVELRAEPGEATRTTALGGLSLPSLPGLRRIELTLPADVPRRSVLEVWLGLAPRFDHPGVTARFRISEEDDGEGDDGGDDGGGAWLDETVEGDGEPAWRRVEHPVETRPGGRVVLEVEASRNGRPLPEGAALWGAPVLVRPDRPAGSDLIVLAIDTLRADVVGAYGSTEGLTPNLDRLAAQSVRFADLRSPAPWTLPSMTSLLTGLQPQSHDAGRTLGSEELAPTALGPAPPTLAGVLASSGFFTAGVYNNIFLGPSFGVSRGFDLYDWVEAEDDALVDRAIELLRRYEDRRRLFLFLHLFGPHNPYQPPGDACEVARRLDPTYHGDLGCRVHRQPIERVLPEEDRRWAEALYKAEVSFTDRQVGRFLDALDAMGLSQRTVLVMMSDHGEDFWGRLDATDRFGGYQVADHGHTQYQELLRVPGMVRAPGLTPRVVGDPVEIVDLFPTELSLLGVEPRWPGGAGAASAGGGEPGSATEGEEARAPDLRQVLQGEDLTPVLAGGRPSRRTLISDFLLYGASRWSVERGPWKLIVPRESADGDDGDLRPELYNLEEDPGERIDLYAERPEIAASLRRLGEAEIARRETLRRQLGAGTDALEAAHLQWNHITKLRALGYLK